MQNERKALKRTAGSVVLYVAAVISALIAVASLVNNILLFRSIVNQYTTQGYAAAEIINQLLTTQLLPEAFKSIALYGGIAGLLMGLGMIYQKVAQLTELQTTVEVCSDNACDAVMEDTPVDNACDAVTEDTPVEMEAVEEGNDSI